jgi:hypothetical protein
VSSSAGPIFVVIVAVLGGEASIKLLSSSALVARTEIGVGADDNGEDICVPQLPLEVRPIILGRVLELTCVEDGLREEDEIDANNPGVCSDPDEEIDSSNDDVVGARRFREERGEAERYLLVMMSE